MECTLPGFPGALTWAYTREDALEKIKEAIQLVIEVLRETTQRNRR